MKIGLISSVLLAAILQTAYYVASHTGSLDRVFLQGTSSTADVEVSPKYSRRAVVVTLVCWTVVALNTILYIYALFTSTNPDIFLDVATTFRIAKHVPYVIPVLTVLLQFQYLASCFFPQAMKKSVVFSTFLCDILQIQYAGALFQWTTNRKSHTENRIVT